MDRTYVSLDLETTGFDPYADDIIEIGAVKFCGDTVLGTYHSLARPLEPLPYRIQILTGITDQDLENAPPSGIALSDLVSFLEDLPIVGHSISFDLSFLSQKGIELANAAYDTWELATILLPTLSDYSLSGVADELGVAYSVRHRALADATVAKDVFLRLLDTGRGLDSSVVAEMVQMAEGTDWAPAHVFRQLSEEKMGRTPSWPTGSTAGVEANGGAEQLVPVRPRELLDAGAVADMLGPQGLMARSLEGFDHRPEQVQMLTAVADAFNESDHLMVEAGTGTGKSIAYLLPASLFAVKNGVRVVISTNTINLQEQLVNKDIPQLARALQGESMPVPRYAQLKGRNNYLCQRRWSLLRRSRPVSAEEVKTVARILVWAASTQSGDRAELSLRGEEQFVWNRVRAQADSCLGAHCPYHKRGECFLYRARRKAEKAHLIVINHALLLSDIASTARARIIPEYSHVIIDEAHHVEDVATEQWGFEVDQQHLEQYLNRVWERVGEGGYGGLLSEVLAQSKAGSVAPAVGEQVQSMVGEAAGWVEECRGRAGSFFNTVRHFVDAHAEDAGYYERRLRLSKAVRTQPGWFDVELSWEKLGAALLEVEAGLNRLYGLVEALSDESTWENTLTELGSLISHGAELRSQLDSVVFRPDDGMVYWGSQGERLQSVALHGAPLHVGAPLQRGLFSGKECVVLTGATLSTEGNFDFIEQRLSLSDGKRLLLDSPFDYRSLAMVWVPTDIPEPGQTGYRRAVEQSILDVSRAAGGRTLGLFTSHLALRSCYEAVYGALRGEGIVVLGQGIDGSTKRLLDAFRAEARTVLLATASFWEGIDVVGEALSVLVIPRLPFGVPTDPVFAARAELFDDPFNQYALPQAILRFKQGFGRLIRSKSDRGVIVVLDRRIKSRNYGTAFLNSLPSCEVRSGPARLLGREVSEWLGRK